MANKLMSKSELIQKIAEKHPDTLTLNDVKGVIESLAEIGYKELKKTGAFVVPGFAKFVVIRSPPQKRERASIRSQRSQQYSRRSRRGRSSRFAQ